MEVSAEDALAEAFKALGESIVRERLLGKRVSELEEQNASLVHQIMHPEQAD